MRNRRSKMVRNLSGTIDVSGVVGMAARTRAAPQPLCDLTKARAGALRVDHNTRSR